MFSLLYQYGHNHCSSLQSVEPFCLANQLDKISGMDDDIIVECLSVCLCLERKSDPAVFKRFCRFSCFWTLSVFSEPCLLYSRDFDISPVSGHFPYSRDLDISPVSRHFWKRLEGLKVGRLEGWRECLSQCNV